MSTKNNELSSGHVGIAGEVRCVITKADGTVKTDTGYQKNLILNQGLDFFGGNKGDTMFYKCAIGAGNTAPSPTQTALDSYITMATGAISSSSYGYTADETNTYKTFATHKYTYTGLKNVTIGEVGLVSQGTTNTDYYLCTRALIKDNLGVAATITILAGETLEIYYKLWQVVSTLAQSYVIDVSDGNGNSTPYNVAIKPVSVGNGDYWGNIGKVIRVVTDYAFYTATTDNTAVNSAPTYQSISLKAFNNLTYVTNSYKRGFYINAGISETNIAIRSIWTGYGSTVPFQIRIGSVANDSAMAKTDLQTLAMNFEFSWGRYEGAL